MPRRTSHVKYLQKLQLPTSQTIGLQSQNTAPTSTFELCCLELSSSKGLSNREHHEIPVCESQSRSSPLCESSFSELGMNVTYLLHLTCQAPTTYRETINSDVLELLWQDSLTTGLAKFEAWRACGTGPLEFMVQRTYLTAVYREARNCSEYQFKPISGCVSKGCFAACTFKDHSGQNHSKKKWSTWASTKTVAGT